MIIWLNKIKKPTKISQKISQAKNGFRQKETIFLEIFHC